MFPTDPIQVSEKQLPTKGWLPRYTRLPMVIAFVRDDKDKKKRFVANYFEECWEKTNQGDVVHRRPFGTSRLGGIKVIYFKNKKDLKKELVQ